MPEHEKKQCPRCNNGFECKSGSILLCQCSKIEMNTEQLEYCQSKYDDCLCITCLQELCSEYDSMLSNEKTKNSLLERS